jgi:hypothetical protein
MISLEGPQRSVPVIVRASNSQRQGNHATILMLVAFEVYLPNSGLANQIAVGRFEISTP